MLYEKLYKYHLKKANQYSKKINDERRTEFIKYKLTHEDFVCGIDKGICLKEYCTANFSEYGCIHLEK